MADSAQKFKPSGMAQATWDYLLKFTIHHEAVVVHMYHNYPKGSKYPDVSCGIGFLMPGQAKTSDPSTKTPTDATVNTWLSFFTKKMGLLLQKMTSLQIGKSVTRFPERLTPSTAKSKSSQTRLTCV